MMSPVASHDCATLHNGHAVSRSLEMGRYLAVSPFIEYSL